MTGKTLGNFECTALLGKGGMGEVYKAKDQKLGRDVAIKVLPEEFARDADRVARFQREAKLLAALNHPNIAAIHGLEESEGTHFNGDAVMAVSVNTEPGFSIVEIPRVLFRGVREIVDVEGGIHSGTGVVRDGLILTSAICPFMARQLNINDGTEELALALVEAMKGEE